MEGANIPMSEWHLAETTLGLAADAHYEVAVLTTGATEAHGRHLPYSTDNIQVEAIAQQACAAAFARGARVVLLPNIPYGVNENTLGFPWTISLRPTTVLSILTDVASSVEQHGIPKLLIVNGHGGNELQPHLRELCRRTKVHLLLVDWYKVAHHAATELFTAPGEHADEMETSLILHLRPDLVRMDLAGDGSTREPVLTAMREGWAWCARPWDRLTKDSGLGDPRGATAEKGARYVDAVVAKLADLLCEMSAASNDDWYPYRGEE